jgi:amidophosphoribosyltransferase
MCGIVGFFSHKPVSVELYESLLHLQHRGQDTAGILTCDERMHLKVGRGLASEVFLPADMKELTGNMGIGHLRYPTNSAQSLAEAQPLTTTFPYGMGLVHNGNIINDTELKVVLKKERRYLNSFSDSELLLTYFASALAEQPPTTNQEALFTHICAALTQLFNLAKGAYSVITAIVGIGLVVFRDPHGIRPLVMGERKNDLGNSDYCFASENIPFYSLGFKSLEDVAPGEVIFINLQGQLLRRQLTTKTFRPCVFEYVYLSRPDTILNNLSVYRTRLRMGENLAQAWKKKYPDKIPDVVVPIPFTSNTPALAFANTLGVRYSEGLYKNPFIGRTFIMPTQEKRIKSVRTKLHPQVTELKNKKVLLVDDSIVRGTTSLEIVKMVREARAKEIYLVSACPPVKFPCYYGVYIPTHQELIANQHDNENAIAKAIGVNLLLYQNLADLEEAVLQRRDLHQLTGLCKACLDGNYICGKPI